VDLYSISLLIIKFVWFHLVASHIILVIPIRFVLVSSYLLYCVVSLYSPEI
jgi:hypothetical protein